MSILHLEKIFDPKRIALLGASVNPNSVSGKTLSNLIGGGYRGVVYPINPAEEAVSGIPCFPSLEALPKQVDLAIICTAAREVPVHVRQCGLAGIQGIIIMSAGFRETGPEGKALEDKVLEEQARFPGMRILGPNCLGVIVPAIKLNASFAATMPAPGNIAFISQSGALCTSVLDWATEVKTGFSYFVSLGNSLDIDFGDLIDYFGLDELTRSIMLYIESVGQARKFMTAARSFARSKPIIVYKAGRYAESAVAAASHTGAMASEDAIYDAAFQRTGMARVYDIGDIFDVAALIGRNRFPRGPRLAIVTNAGGPGVMATDTLISLNGVLAKLSDTTLEELNQNLPGSWSRGNPVDVLGDARSKRIAKAVAIVLKDQAVDAVLVILTPQAMTNPLATAREVGELAKSTQKPILAAWIGGKSMRDGIQHLIEAGIAAYQTPEQAIRSFMTLVHYARNLEILYETPRDIPLEFNVDKDLIHEELLKSPGTEASVLSEESSKKLLLAYGIPVTLPLPAASPEEAVSRANALSYPVVMKIHSPDITHKSDVGGVALNLSDEAMVRQAYTSMISNVRSKLPGARLLGVSVQKMAAYRDGLELILGIKKDPVFGTVIMAGMGGTAAELYADKALGFPPLNERLARLMLESLRIFPLITGYRGSPPKNLDKLIEVLIRMSYLAANHPEIKELDINPLLVTPLEVLALDARVLVENLSGAQGLNPYAHLALQPYPEKYARLFTLADNTSILLRPIKPEDEPLWFDLLRSCSSESIYSRFRYVFHWETHEVASRYCYLDYDREIAIVAEVNLDGQRKLVGVGRLVADPDHENAEFAILITDAWQNRDLGQLITEYCLEVARDWKMKRVTAQTTPDNPRMIALFRKSDFEIQNAESLVIVSKQL